MSIASRVEELKEKVKDLISEINAIPGGIRILYHEPPGHSNTNMGLDGGSGKLYIKPRGKDAYLIALSTQALWHEMGQFMVDLCGKEHDKLSHEKKGREPYWIVNDFEMVRAASYYYAKKEMLALPEDVLKAPINEGAEVFRRWEKENDKRSGALPFDLLKERAEQAPLKTREIVVQSVLRIRSSDVSVFAKKRANGVCDLCRKPAPFNNPSGEPFLESHHIDWLSNDGKDGIDNVVALCPNCHRQMHILDNLEDRNKLKKRIQDYKAGF
jgi:5-methylcytosine-specific restriction protein A